MVDVVIIVVSTARDVTVPPLTSRVARLQHMATPRYAIALHGGAGTIAREHMTPEKDAEFRAALAAALKPGVDVLQRGGRAMDAVCMCACLYVCMRL